MKSLHSPEPGASNHDEEIDLVAVLDVLVDYRWIILKICLACLALATVFAFLFPPKYQADISVQVEDGTGMASAQSLLGDVSSLFNYNSPTSAEQQIMASRLVVTSVVDELHSYIVVRPQRFPLIGDFISRFNDTLTHPGIFGLGGWAWGTESADVSQFDVPKRMEGDRFTLTVLADNQYRLSGWDLDKAVTGRIGEPLVTGTKLGPVTLLVKSLCAVPGTKFKLIRNSRLDTIVAMQMGLDIQEKIKSSGILIASLKGADPVTVRDQLQAVGRYYVKQNVERKSTEAAQSLAFLGTQVPLLKQQLEDAEARYTKMQNRQGTVDLSEEAKIALQQVADSKTRMLELQQKRNEIASRFTGSHPDVVALDLQIATLGAQQSTFDTQVRRLPDVEQEAVRLKLDVKVHTDLYIALLNNVQQLKLVQAGKTGSVRLVDAPVIPESIAFPNRPLTMAAGALIGLLLGVGFAFVHSFLFSGIAEADEIEKHTGLGVYATIPTSRYQKQIDTGGNDKRSAGRLLVEAHPHEPAVESLRSLRTALQFSMAGASSNVILVSGPTPGVGKSFVSANFAALLASSGKRVLLIDGDLRRGYLHQYFGHQREPGLMDAIAGKRPLNEVIRKSTIQNLDFITTGELPVSAAEALIHERVRKIFESCRHDYDVVVVDSPPVLVATDAVLLARHCATVLLVARAGRTRVSELSESVRRFAHNGVAVNGVLLNGIDPKSGRRAYSRKHGGYRYTQYSYEDSREAQHSGWRQLITRLVRRG